MRWKKSHQPPDSDPQADAVRRDALGDGVDRDADLEQVMQVQIEVAQAEPAEHLEHGQQRLALVRRRRREHAPFDCAQERSVGSAQGRATHHTAGNSSDFWYAEFTVSGIPQYLNSECRPT